MKIRTTKSGANLLDFKLVEFAEIRKDLPNWPDDVIDQWLLKLANRGIDTGWPPPENFNFHAWKYILGGRPISWWVHVAWSLEELNIRFEDLARNTRRIINDMIGAHLNGVMNYGLASPDSRHRFLSALRYLAQHGTLPRPLITFRARDGLSVLDGNHRVAALCVYRQTADIVAQFQGIALAGQHQVWVGTHPTGEQPLD